MLKDAAGHVELNEKPQWICPYTFMVIWRGCALCSTHVEVSAAIIKCKTPEEFPR